MRACALRDDREEEPDGVDALFEQSGANVLRELRVVEHDGHDRGVPRLEVEPGLGEALAPVRRRSSPACRAARWSGAESSMTLMEARDDQRGRSNSRRGTDAPSGGTSRPAPRRPETQPPDAPPSALPKVVVMTSSCPCTPQCSWVPRPVLPMNPEAWESSTRTMASYFSAERDDLVELGDVAVHREDAVGDDHLRRACPACTWSFSSRWAMSECLKVSCHARCRGGCRR